MDKDKLKLIKIA